MYSFGKKAKAAHPMRVLVSRPLHGSGRLSAGTYPCMVISKVVEQGELLVITLKLPTGETQETLFKWESSRMERTFIAPLLPDLECRELLTSPEQLIGLKAEVTIGYDSGYIVYKDEHVYSIVDAVSGEVLLDNQHSIGIAMALAKREGLRFATTKLLDVSTESFYKQNIRRFKDAVHANNASEEDSQEAESDSSEPKTNRHRKTMSGRDFIRGHRDDGTVPVGPRDYWTRMGQQHTSRLHRFKKDGQSN